MGFVRYIRGSGALGQWRPLAPFAALFVLLIVFAVGGMLVIAHEADRSDASRAREAVVRTFDAMLLRLDLAAEMNAATGPIAATLADPQATPASIYGYFTFTNRMSMGYFGAIVLNADGSAFGGTRFGLPWTGASLAAAARTIAPVAARLPAHGGTVVHGLVRDDDGRVMAIAVINVAGPGQRQPGQPGQPATRRLAMIAPVGDQIIPYMLPSLGVEHFRVAPAGPGETSVALPVGPGPPIVFAWQSRSPGRAAIRRWVPAIGALLVTALVMLVHAGRSTMAALRALERLARRDHLTGLANRSAFSDELARRQGRADAIALGMIDLNGFKAVNDAHGHLVGDGLLRAVATELTASAGPGDFVARLGGDEFAWISPSRAAADRLAGDFAARLVGPLAVGALRLQTGAAIGVALAGPRMTAGALMAMADARLYHSKDAARRGERGAITGDRKATRRRTATRDAPAFPPHAGPAPHPPATAPD